MHLTRTTPLNHQAGEHATHFHDVARGRFWECGTGKTYTAIADALSLAELKEINGLLVMAPSGVHEAWLEDELPTHVHPEQLASWGQHKWSTGKSGRRWAERRVDAAQHGQAGHHEAALKALKHPGMSVVCMSYDGIMTDAGGRYAREFLESRRCLMVLDEAHKIKTPGSKRTIRSLAAARYAPFRRILTGTLVADKPFDVYSPIKFLDADAWKHLGVQDSAAFRAMFGIFMQCKDPRTGNAFERVVGYRNLDLLNQVVAKWGSRVRKDEVLDLPPKTYSKRHFDLSSEQRRVYDQIRKEFFAELPSGAFIPAELAIVRMTRLQQVASGYLPVEGQAEPVEMIGTTNPRLDALMEVLEEAEGQKVIVWAKYRLDIDLILAALKAEGIEAVRYDGACSEDEAAESRERFKRGSARVFVSNPAKGGEGLTLNVASLMVYYDNGFKLLERVQSEDRFHRVGQTKPTHVVDLIARATVDTHIVDSLRKKRELAGAVMGDEVKSWI